MTVRLTTRWVILYYALTGLPFGLLYDAVPLYLRFDGRSVVTIGLTNLVQLAWALKIVWSPLVARFGSPRRWVLGCQSVLGAGLLMLALRAYRGEVPYLPLPLILVAMALAGATQDIAVDGVFVSAVERGDEAKKNGVRVSTYRIAMALGGAGATYVAGLFGYAAMFLMAGIVTLGACLVVGSQASVENRTVSAERLGDVVRSISKWMRRPSSYMTLLFILTFKLGDGCIEAMGHVFWVDQGLTGREIGLFNMAVGLPLSIFGALVGGWYTNRVGIAAALGRLGLLQASAAGCYAIVSIFDLARPALLLACAIHPLTHALATSALMTFLTSVCDRKDATVQYATLTSVMALMRATTGSLSGLVVSQIGFSRFFVASFVLALPALTLLCHVGRRLEHVRR